MKDETITVYSQDGMGLSVFVEVAKRKGVRNGQRLSDREMAEVGIENAREGIARCQMEIAMDDFNERNK